jgi:hypothetical protein
MVSNRRCLCIGRGTTRRVFLSASAAGAVAAPIISLIQQIDPDRIQATILRLTQFGTRHTASSQTDPVRGTGAAVNWVTEQMQAIAATSSGNMTVQQQTFVQPVANNIPVPTTITNVIATLQGTGSPQRYYVMTGHLDSRGRRRRAGHVQQRHHRRQPGLRRHPAGPVHGAAVPRGHPDQT